MLLTEKNVPIFQTSNTPTEPSTVTHETHLSDLNVVAGDRHELYSHIAEMIEVEIEQIVTRHVNRRTGRRASEFYESVFIWRKR
ncbi:MAG: hypothetical protein DRR08_17470 [Candidatus Parabeggiatoa sp. nov. 2]|nr:MAG: hypothetical protein B6247_29645 [Beggiatoa sp. 4572_84]RKZ58015.1 MAG: hypothetical protein DRR08_17470 [Gammaproteobacteria bacterium]